MNRLAFDMEGEPYIDDHGEFVTFADHRDALYEQRQTDAALVEAAGCLCGLLEFDRYTADDGADSPIEWNAAGEAVIHDPRCPEALAAKIRGQA